MIISFSQMKAQDERWKLRVYFYVSLIKVLIMQTCFKSWYFSRVLIKITKSDLYSYLEDIFLQGDMTLLFYLDFRDLFSSGYVFLKLKKLHIWSFLYGYADQSLCMIDLFNFCVCACVSCDEIGKLYLFVIAFL